MRMTGEISRVPGITGRWSWPSPAERVIVGSVLVSLVAISAYLWPFWRESPELSHGYFAPLCSLALLWQSRREHDLSTNWNAVAVLVIQWLILLLGLGSAALATLAAVAQGPFHSQTAFLTGIAASALLLSGTLALARGKKPVVHLSGASLCAAALWWAVAPLPSGTLARFTLLLQDMITAGSVRAVHWFGLPATRDGNIIRLADALVGVADACSGIRSLTACLFAGIVLGGLMLQGLLPRVALVLAAGVLAVLANFIRSVTLCLLAAHGVKIEGMWHDGTAFAVLGVTALALFGGCLLLSKTSATAAAPRLLLRPESEGRHLPHLVLSGATVLLLIWVGLKLSPSPEAGRRPPDLAGLMVIDDALWQRRTDESVLAFSAALNTTLLRQETYLRGDTQLTLYVAYWSATQSTLGSVALHTPDICLPGTGWATRVVPVATAKYPLPSPRRFLFEKETYPQHVWFWHFFGGRPITETKGLYPWQLGPLIMKGTIRAKAPQWVVRISSNKPLETLLAEPLVQEFFNRLRAAGVTDLAG
jgi:exosortase